MPGPLPHPALSHPAVAPSPRWIRRRPRTDRNQPAEDKPVPWETIAQIIGIVAGLAAWISIVGVAQLWARLSSIDVPTLPTLAGLDQGWFVAAGLQTLLVPLILGAVVSLTFLFSLPAASREVDDQLAEELPPESDRRWRWILRARPITNARRMATHPAFAGWVIALVVASLAGMTFLIADGNAAVLLWTTAGSFLVLLAGVRLDLVWLLALAPVVLCAGFYLSLRDAVDGTSLAVMLGVTVLALWVTLGAIDLRRRVGAALILFVALAAWSGALGFAKAAGDTTPEFATASVLLTDGQLFGGFYVGRSTTQVLLAQPLGVSESRSVIVLPLERVARITYGDTTPVPTPSNPAPAPVPSEPTREPATADPPVESPDSGSVPPEWLGPLDPEVPVSTRNASVDTVSLQLQVLSLARRPNGYLELDFTLINLSAEPLPLNVTFSRNGRTTSFDGVTILDPAKKVRYGVATTADGCVCDQGLDRVVLSPGSSRRFAMAFEVIDPMSERMDIQFPVFGWIKDVPVT